MYLKKNGYGSVLYPLRPYTRVRFRIRQERVASLFRSIRFTFRSVLVTKFDTLGNFFSFWKDMPCMFDAWTFIAGSAFPMCLHSIDRTHNCTQKFGFLSTEWPWIFLTQLHFSLPCSLCTDLIHFGYFLIGEDLSFPNSSCHLMKRWSGLESAASSRLGAWF